MREPIVENRHASQVVTGLLLLLLLLFGGHAVAAAATEIAFDDADVSIEAIEPLSPEELETLVAPIALYADDLLGIVLPASTYPLQIVQASRFLESRADDDTLQPDAEWDDSIVALLNYPEVLSFMNDDLDWTWQLGEAVLMQQAEVIDAVAEFRERARLAGNLESDEHQTVVVNDDGVIEIDPVNPEELYIPYYEPEAVTVYQRHGVYHYYPRAYPVYYYPYPSDHYFQHHFWGVTSVFSIGWRTHHLHLHHYGFNDHPYYGYSYYDPFYFRQPHLWLSLNYYDDHRRYRHGGRHHRGNFWHGNRHHRGAAPTDRQREQQPAREAHDRADRRRQRRLASQPEVFEGAADRPIRHSRPGRRASTRSQSSTKVSTSDTRNTSTSNAAPRVEQPARRAAARRRPSDERARFNQRRVTTAQTGDARTRAASTERAGLASTERAEPARTQPTERARTARSENRGSRVERNATRVAARSETRRTSRIQPTGIQPRVTQTPQRTAVASPRTNVRAPAPRTQPQRAVKVTRQPSKPAARQAAVQRNRPQAQRQRSSSIPQRSRSSARGSRSVGLRRNFD